MQVVVDAEDVRTADARVALTSEPRRTSRRVEIARSSVVKALALAAVSIVVVLLALVPYPSVLGHWEAESTFPMMAGDGPPLSFELYPQGNIGATGQYGLINLGYYVAEWFGWSLTALRLPVLIAGVASVAVFGIIAGRTFGFWAGIVTAVALALNPMFLVFWHQLIVSTITMAFLLLVLERTERIETTGSLRWSVPLLALAYTFVLLHYAVGRFMATAIVGHWAILVLTKALHDRRTGERVDRASLLGLASFGLLVIVFAAVLDWDNVQYLRHPVDLFFPPMGEFVKRGNEVDVMLQNLPILLTMIVPPLDLAPERFGDFTTDLIVDFRNYLVPTVMVPLVLLGVGVVVGRAGRSAGARLTLLLLAVTLIGPLFSAQVGEQLSIAAYRAFYAIVPLYLCAAAGAGWLLARRQAAVRIGVAAGLVAILAIQAVTVTTEMQRHRAFVEDLARRWQPGDGLAVFAGPHARRTTAEDEVLMNGTYRYYVGQVGVPSLAVAQRLLATLSPSGRGDEVVVVQLDGVPWIRDMEGAHKLVFYLHELGAPAALYDQALGTIRGAGLARPAYVIALDDAAAAAAQNALQASGNTVTVRRFDPWS